ncbi:hypothetical protein [Gimesia aquarii]|uniref:SMI1 / KNR4 family protein n=1 Tax=Gimesia aquarii TaxID=2527964 RepID=A0A517VYF5_9PLAN|nr:hypothetical protein [Gimesia aquarii]QDT98039.1 hypothetical protein V144x_35230 [Gimesia aquarii]
MVDSPFAMLVAQIEREFGVSIPISPSTDVAIVPDTLRPLYSFSDGLTLPFANIHKMADCNRTTYPDWICFGSDNYFSYFLCHVSQAPALTTWDHEVHTEIEGVFDTAIDWLTDEYESFIDTDTDDNAVRVTEIPDGVSKTAAITEIKPICDKSSSDLLGLFRSGAFVIPNVVRSDAFNVVRALHDLGISCHVECNT